jgi:hypothetical protein
MRTNEFEQGALGGIVVEVAFVEAASQRGPTSPHIIESRGEFGFARELAHGIVGPKQPMPRPSALTGAGLLPSAVGAVIS